MNFIASTFDGAGGLYARLFADWLHVHFIIRTAIVLLILWLIIFLVAQVVQFVVAPLVYLFVYRVIMRDGYATYSEMLYPARRFTVHAMLICAVAVTLWVSAFGLHHEYAAPAVPAAVPAEYFEPPPGIYNEETPEEPEPALRYGAGEWGENAVFVLNEYGQMGAWLRDGPGIDGQTIIEVLWDDATLRFLNAYVPDAYVDDLHWLRVESPTGTVGYISSQQIIPQGAVVESQENQEEYP